MVKTNYVLSDDFDARQMYSKAIFYSGGGWEKNVRIISFSADNVNNRWREHIVEFIDLKTEAILRLYSYPDSLNDKGFQRHFLKVKFSGEEIESAKKALERMTGIGLK